MEHLPPEGLRCDRCSTGFSDVGELAKHRQSHETEGMDDLGTRPDGLHLADQRPREGLKDIMSPMPSIRLDDSDEEARSTPKQTKAIRPIDSL